MSTTELETRDELARRFTRRLFLLRNITILVASAGIAVANISFGLNLPLQPLIITLSLLALLNLLTWLRLKSGYAISDTELFIQMLLDIAAITSLFYYTGGATNPFVWFYLLPLIIAATILPRGYTWTMAALTVACYSALFVFNEPLPGADMHHGGMHHDGGFQMHVFGMWLGFVMSAGFVAVIIVGMAQNLRERDRRLAEAREQALQNERLVALGTLATGAAHELGTPLGTMAILTAELEQEYIDDGHSGLHRKLGILRSQIDRCKEALSVLSASAGAGRAESGHRMPVDAYLDEVIHEWHASPDDVSITGSSTQALLTLEVSDRGTGLSAEVQEQLGKAPVSTKQEGLGVGLYLAHATIERLGGSLEIADREQGGTVVRITLPLLSAVTD